MKARWLAVTAAALAVGVAAEPAESREPVCGPGGIDVTVALAYDPNAGGPIAGTLIDVAFTPPLALPSSPQALRDRLKSLLPQAARVQPVPSDAGRLRVAVTTTEQGIQPSNAFRMRFDCPEGARVEREQLTCGTTQIVGASGQPLEEDLARTVRCQVVALDPVRP